MSAGVRVDDRSPSPRTRSREPQLLRALALVVLIVGIVAAGVRYWQQVRAADPVMDEVSAPGYLRARHRQTGQMMGPFGLILSDWGDTLTSPGAQAAISIGTRTSNIGPPVKLATTEDAEDAEGQSCTEQDFASVSSVSTVVDGFGTGNRR